MKKYIVFTFLCLCLCLSTSARSYKPMLTDGKVWKWEYQGTLPKKGVYYLAVQGDTIVDDRVCKKIYIKYGDDGDYVPYHPAYEDDGKVYVYGSGINMLGFEKLLDFGMNPGDVTDSNYSVVSVDFVQVGGESLRRTVLRSVYWSEGTAVWVEGIGTGNEVSYPSFPFTDGFGSKRMLECYDNGKLVFVADDFTKGLAPTAIDAPEAVEADGAKAYDTMGRTLKDIPESGIYIKNGRKLLGR